jgi:DNA processing protein
MFAYHSVMTSPADHISLLALLRIKGISWSYVAREAQRPDGLEKLLAGRPSEVSVEAKEAAGLLSEHQQMLEDKRAEIEEMLETATRDGIRYTTVLDADYPVNLRTIFNLPPFLFYRGALLEEDARAVAVVGTREPSDAGLSQADEMARLLAQNGVVVLSGLARGVDTAAHTGCLGVGGRTIAVVGTGIRKVYPAENAELCEEIAQKGAVVSQFWPDAAPTRYAFPRRNVVMSGMAQGTVVIEASATSGAKMQARLALEHGKRVFLLSSLVQQHQWARTYAERGATVVESVDDILAQLRSPAFVRERADERQQLSLAI